ncbi:hypothetical protein A3G67_00470 [Candidatus Roizmanbacteria bacterium RIFCSPLOWO2_12_FULL_40_12]|nr:MAG: hypothetical protein A3G67_00470 [Candidatus Roizmanbacteria bacterium RIFCSPLOWO2_12_FULL_40_12]
MVQLRKFIGIFFVCAFFFFLPLVLIRADELEDVTKQLETLRADLSKKEADHGKLSQQLDGIKQRVVFIEQEIVKKEREVREGEKILDRQRTLLYARARSYYKNINKNAFSLLNLLVSDNLSSSLQNFFYQSVLVDEDRNEIIKIVLYIKGLEDKKESLARERVGLAALKVEIDKQTQLLAGEISTKKQQVAQLTEKQTSLIAAKLASLNIPRSAGTSSKGCSSDLTNGKSSGFSPSLGFFSYGVPHRNGLNQYGAWGRAKAGQNEETILSEYYPGKSLNKGYDQGVQIKTNTGWSGSIEDYVKRIYEVPDSWTDNNLAVLKAQAVAARSYALNVTGNGSKEICTTESCQVFKPDPKGGNWEQAVNATAGWVLMDGGSPAFTQYASTHGGYIKSIGKFDGPGGNPGNFGDLNSRAYDKDSPWFYCDWGSRSEYGGTAWLKTSEVADIANVILLARRDSGTSSHLSQTDAGVPDTWDAEKVKVELRARGGSPYNHVTDVSIGADFGSGSTASVNVSGDGSGGSFSGDEWKNWFNARAPANIYISGPLYNFEKR